MGFYFLLKLWVKIRKITSKILSGKYSQKLLDHTKNSATDALKTSSEAIGDLIGNIIADRTMKVSKHSPPNNLETVTNDHDKEIP